MQSFSTAFVATCWRRVAIERMKTRGERSEFMRMRSPSSAPPVRRRVGSTEITAMRMAGKACRKRLMISSVTELLPAPPVPVRPTTGVLPPASCQPLRRVASSVSAIRPSSMAESMRPTAISSCTSTAVGFCVGWRCWCARRTRSSIIPTRPICMPSFGW